MIREVWALTGCECDRSSAKAVGLKLWPHQNPLEGLFKPTAGPHPQSFLFLRSEEGLRICISNKILGDHTLRTHCSKKNQGQGHVLWRKCMKYTGVTSSVRFRCSLFRRIAGHRQAVRDELGRTNRIMQWKSMSSVKEKGTRIFFNYLKNTKIKKIKKFLEVISSWNNCKQHHGIN